MPKILMLMFASLVLCTSRAIADGLKISVIGAGKVGGTLGTLWVKAGHSVMFSSRHPEELTDLVKRAGPNARAGGGQRPGDSRFRRRQPGPGTRCPVGARQRLRAGHFPAGARQGRFAERPA